MTKRIAIVNRKKIVSKGLLGQLMEFQKEFGSMPKGHRHITGKRRRFKFH